MKQYYWMIFFLIMSATVQAAPSGADLLEACEISLEQGFQTTKGMLCVWYVTPCDCHYGKDSEVPRVCLPEGLDAEFLAKEVISGLKLDPILQAHSAEIAAGKVLVKKYSCD